MKQPFNLSIDGLPYFRAFIWVWPLSYMLALEFRLATMALDFSQFFGFEVDNDGIGIKDALLFFLLLESGLFRPPCLDKFQISLHFLC